MGRSLLLGPSRRVWFEFIDSPCKGNAQCELDQQLGFRPGDEDIRRHQEIQRPEFLAAHDVLPGLAGQPASQHGFEAGAALGRHAAEPAGVQGASVDIAGVRQQDLGVEKSRFDPRVREAGGCGLGQFGGGVGRRVRLCGGVHQLAAFRASVWWYVIRASSSGWSSPSITRSREYRVRLMR